MITSSGFVDFQPLALWVEIAALHYGLAAPAKARNRPPRK